MNNKNLPIKKLIDNYLRVKSYHQLATSLVEGRMLKYKELIENKYELDTDIYWDKYETTVQEVENELSISLEDINKQKMRLENSLINEGLKALSEIAEWRDDITGGKILDSIANNLNLITVRRRVIKLIIGYFG